MKVNRRMLLGSSKSTPFTTFLVALAAISLLSLAGCGGGSGTSATQNSAAQNPAVQSVANTSPSAAQPHMIGGNRQMAVVYECWYALRQGWINPNGQSTPPSAGPSGGKSINGDIVSDWRYLSPSADGNSNALRYALNTYHYDVSMLLPDSGPTMSASTIEAWVNKLNADPYDYNFGSYKSTGHGCQCVAFASMILYRALNGSPLLNGKPFSWTYPTGSQLSSYPSATTAVPGDIVFYYTDAKHLHVAICVGTSGTSVTLVDSNFVGGAGQEVIGRHTVSLTSAGKDSLGNIWKRYNGSGRWY